MKILSVIAFFTSFAVQSIALQAATAESSFEPTRVVILGTGTPVPDASRSGPGVAIITNGQAYVFDAGGGMVKKAVQASQNFNIPELTPQNINFLFLTHLHSDHIHDVSELTSSRWWGRQQRLAIYGPQGLTAYVAAMNTMNTIEADIRAAGTPEQLVTDSEGFKAEATEIESGIIFQNADIVIEAFTVPHGEIRPAFGYKIITADKSIVISGDTTFSELIAEKAQGVDLLIHEVASADLLSEQSEFWQQYHGHSHTTTTQVAQIANLAQPGILILTHILFLGQSAEGIVAEVERDYAGEVVLANDLDMF